MIETIDIVADLVSKIKLGVRINSQSTVDDIITLVVDKTHYLSKDFPIVINGNQYLIVEVVNNESITLKGNSPIVVSTFNLEPLKYYHGTILQTGKELAKEDDAFEITPMAYLKRPITDKFQDDDSRVERETDISLFFLTQSDFEEWETLEHDTNAVIPMHNMANGFIEVLKSDAYIGLIDGYEITDRTKFGVVIDKGTEKGYWTKQLSGVQLDITLPIIRNYYCNCNC
jgi:hypothetical protein